MPDWHSFISNIYSFELFVFLTSIAAGSLGAILGLGGGIVVIPALTLLCGVNIRYAVGASIISVIATSTGAAATYVRDHITNIRVAMVLEVATTIGALGGVMLSPYVPTRYLFMGFAALLLYSGLMMMGGRKRDGIDSSVPPMPPAHNDSWATKLKLNSSYPDSALKQEIPYTVSRVPLGFSLMFGAGLVSGLLGVGSGALKVPAMDTAMRLPIKVSSATSNFMIGVTAAASAGAYYMRGEILPILAAPVALGVMVGSLLGTRLMMKLPSSSIRKTFVIVLILIAVQMALKGLGIGGS